MSSLPTSAVIEPELVALARRLVVEGTSRSEGTDQLVRHASGDIEKLAEAKSYWIRRLPTAKSGWDDQIPALMLGMLEDASALLRPMPRSGDVIRHAVHRWWQLRKS